MKKPITKVKVSMTFDIEQFEIFKKRCHDLGAKYSTRANYLIAKDNQEN